MSFQDNLRRYREPLYASAKEFAEVLGIPYPTYLGYENKGAEPKYAVLCKIASILHVSTDELLGYSGDENDWIESKLKPALCDTAINIAGIQPDGKIILSYVKKDTKTEQWTYSLDEMREFYDAAEREAEMEKGKRVSEILYKTLLEIALMQ